ncbi:hypothetical protein ACJX0J_021667, partial [Zea mays]
IFYLSKYFTHLDVLLFHGLLILISQSDKSYLLVHLKGTPENRSKSFPKREKILRGVSSSNRVITDLSFISNFVHIADLIFLMTSFEALAVLTTFIEIIVATLPDAQICDTLYFFL